ncbi:MAG: GGDEF domain-containing protein [Deltaproteobacteria bacterium]|nr:GGDEF domain-containing protein [Deltaproteobacteria bacterium]
MSWGEDSEIREKNRRSGSATRLGWGGIATAFSVGAPLGLVFLRGSATSDGPTPDWIVAELASQGPTYLYLVACLVGLSVLLPWIGRAREEELIELSRTDALTGLANRRHLEERMQQEAARAARSRTSMAVLFIDLDGLREINARDGHLGGDAALCAVAESLRLTCRCTDFAARFGGDEFVVIAPDTDGTSALKLADRIRSTLLMSSLEKRHALPTASVSIGVASLVAPRPSQIRAVLAAADDALATAKARGRDRAVLAVRDRDPAPELYLSRSDWRAFELAREGTDAGA